ncbi:hypothetical protein SAMN05428977_10741 [Nitrosomonas sp. Nm166]|nr:hypothetical protein SAMN05428977_10741 [Nitrosomonas sp. Nm166]
MLEIITVRLSKINIKLMNLWYIFMRWWWSYQGFQGFFREDIGTDQSNPLLHG